MPPNVDNPDSIIEHTTTVKPPIEQWDSKLFGFSLDYDVTSLVKEHGIRNTKLTSEQIEKLLDFAFFIGLKELHLGCPILAFQKAYRFCRSAINHGKRMGAYNDLSL